MAKYRIVLSDKEKLRLFDVVWDFLAERCDLDTRGGAQYRRLRSQYIAEDYPSPISAWLWAQSRNDRP